MYKITEYTLIQAKKHGFIIKSSSRKNKKLDVYKNGIFLGSIGNILYSDLIEKYYYYLIFYF